LAGDVIRTALFTEFLEICLNRMPDFRAAAPDALDLSVGVRFCRAAKMTNTRRLVEAGGRPISFKPGIATLAR
jgi:hypothetical protein